MRAGRILLSVQGWVKVESRPQHSTMRRRKVRGSYKGAKTDTTPKVDEGIRSSGSSGDLAKDKRKKNMADWNELKE